MASSKDSSNVKENSSDGNERKIAQKQGKRELQEIEIETYENEDLMETGNWEVAGNKSKKAILNSKLKPSKSSSFDQDAPSTSKESSPSLLPCANEGDAKIPSGSKTSPEPSDRKRSLKDQISFFSGNPFVEKVQGILHFYKENQMTSLEESVPRSQLIAMLAIPAWLSCHDLLNFIAPCYPGVQRVRVIRDKTPNQYMALVLFRSQEEADEFYKTFNGTPYNSMESEVCHLVYVARVEISGGESSDPFEGIGPPISGLTELPTCTVCLERMDESVDGILTILCNHSFHGTCLAKWGDTTCPVCRFLQSPEVAAESSCSECDSNESLWICLICGHVGCGRYVEGHAYRHFVNTQHCYALQLGNARVWDYVGDNFVHRLLQNNADGKLVEVEGNRSSRQLASSKGENMEHDEKLDSIQLEYMYLLQEQLTSQKIHFEGIIEQLKKQHRKDTEELREQLKAETEEIREKFKAETEGIREQLKAKTKENEKLCSKEKKMNAKLSKVVSELQEEKELNRSLASNQNGWQERVSVLEQQLSKLREEKDTSIKDLQEQLQDIMLYFDAQEKCKNTELEGGQVTIGPRPSSETPNGAKNKKRGK